MQTVPDRLRAAVLQHKHVLHGNCMSHPTGHKTQRPWYEATQATNTTHKTSTGAAHTHVPSDQTGQGPLKRTVHRPESVPESVQLPTQPRLAVDAFMTSAASHGISNVAQGMSHGRSNVRLEASSNAKGRQEGSALIWPNAAATPHSMYSS